METGETQLELIRRASAGDAVSLQFFLLQHRHRLLNYVNRHLHGELRNTVDPQDVVQDVFFEACQHIQNLRADNFRSAIRWLMTIARNRVIQLVRRHQAAKHGGAVRMFHETVNGSRSVVVMLQDLAVYERTPSQSAIAHEMVGVLQKSLNQLPAEYRTALRYRYIDGLPVREIAQRMNRTDHAIHMLCNRGLKQLRVQMRALSAIVPLK